MGARLSLRLLVIMAMAVRHPDVLREAVPAARGKRFVVGVALGLPDAEAPANSIARERAPMDEIVTWVS
jgi:hypothetical protein